MCFTAGMAAHQRAAAMHQLATDSLPAALLAAQPQVSRQPSRPFAFQRPEFKPLWNPHEF
jgi:hypothetical protein